METALLRTKLYRPRPRADLVARPRLIERLSLGLNRKLTLVAAPAGFGKSTLVSSWLAQIERPSAWLAMDEGDNDPARFLHYFIAALRDVVPDEATDFGLAAEASLRSPQPPASESLMVTLINEIAAWPESFVLALDDYHVITDPQIHASVELLIDHMPTQMHLVMTSRSDPPLPLPRLRARRTLNYLGATDLRFTLDETAAFFNDMMHLGLSEQDIAHLDSRSEGWVASLQLAAAAIQSNPEPAEQRRIVEAFAGDDRHIMDYLMSEVLERQPRYIQNFLLQTSVLKRLNVRLCNAVTGQVGSQQILETLDQANLFVEPLDNKRNWFRYHQLFAEFLQSRLERTSPEQLPLLHVRAGAWYAEHDYVDDAIEHALMGGNAEDAAHLLEEYGITKLWSQGQMLTVLRWLDLLPAEVRDCRPYLAQARAWALFGMGKWDALETYLPIVEAGTTLSPTEKTTVDGKTAIRPPLPGQVAVLRAEVALFRGEMQEAMTYIDRALSLLDKDDLVSRSMVLQSVGYIYRLQGEVEAATQALRESADVSGAAGNLPNQLFALTDLAEVQIIAGAFDRASDTLTEAIRAATESEYGPTLMICCAYVALGHLLYERNELDEARERLQSGLDLATRAGFNGYVRQAHLYLAQVALAEGDAQRADEEMASALGLSAGANTPWIADRVAMHDAERKLALGKIEEAHTWAVHVLEEEQSRPHIPRYQRHLEELLCSQILFATSRSHDASVLLTRCHTDATENRWGQSLIRVAVLQAAVASAQGKAVAASMSIQEALTLAAPQGNRRPFLDAGPAVHDLLRTAVARGVQPEFAQDLLTTLEEAAPSGALSSPNEALAEPLTERELEILQLIAAGHSNRQIGEQLFIAIGTVGKHTSNIFMKLDAPNRAGAVVRAQELGLI